MRYLSAFFLLISNILIADAQSISVDEDKLKGMAIAEIASVILDNGREGKIIYNGAFENSNLLSFALKPIGENKPSVLKKKVTCQSNVGGKPLQSAVSYELSGGRFGDNLLAYFHAKWLAREYGLPFLFKSFPYAESLRLSKMDQPLSFYTNYNRTLKITQKQQAASAPPSTLIVVPYFSESKFEYDMLNHKKEGRPFFVVDWDDCEFHKEVVECLTPIVPVKTLSLPSDCITVALHVRRGGKYESYKDAAKGYPLKFPPDNYYLSQLQQVTHIFKDQRLYVYIFTDDCNPQIIAENYAKVIDNPNVEFDWQEGDSNMLDDFYSMGKFDCLIRCMSNFSIMASVLGDYSLMFTPTHAHFLKGEVIIDQVEIRIKGH